MPVAVTKIEPVTIAVEQVSVPEPVVIEQPQVAMDDGMAMLLRYAEIISNQTSIERMDNNGQLVVEISLDDLNQYIKNQR